MNFKLLLASLFLVIINTLWAQDNFYTDPSKVKLITTDIPNFWNMYENLASAKSTSDSIAIIQRDYFDKASIGLKEMTTKKRYAFSSEDMFYAIKRYPRYINSIKKSSLQIDLYKKRIYKAFHRLKKIYPQAKFPDFYFAFGVFGSGGTGVPSGMFIGAEIETASQDSPRDELPSFLVSGVKTVDKIHYICAHEVIHFQQTDNPKDLLGTSIHEGACDFIGGLISGGLINEAQHEYGKKNEAALWKLFQTEMHGNDYSKWLYNGGAAKDTPADLGYFMGYQICRAYYERQANKGKAIEDILSIGDYGQFLKDSGYNAK